MRRCTLFGATVAPARTAHRMSAGVLSVQDCHRWFYVQRRAHSLTVAADESSLLTSIRSGGTTGGVELEDVVSQASEVQARGRQAGTRW
jgi:hypothetical protein